MGGREYGLDTETVAEIARDVGAVVAMGVEVCLVIGGGNIFRGVSGAAGGMDRAAADYMGMLATVMNALAMQNALEKIEVPTRVQSAIPMASVCEPYIRRRAMRHMEKGRVVIFAAGTGNPFFTTDTAAALRAAEMGCDALLKGTQVDGVYTADPRKVASARRFEQHVRRRGRDLRGRAAHHGGERDHAGIVGDHHVVGVQHPGRTVQSGQLLPGDRAADHQRAGERVQVERVHRLAQLEHHIVGNVDQQRDRPHPGVDQTLLDDLGRRRRRVDPAHGDGGEPVASGRVLDQNRVTISVRDQRRDQRSRIRVRQRQRMCQLAGDAAHREAVPAIRRDRQLDDQVVQPDDRPRLRTRLGGTGRQHDDAGVVVADAQLATGADHSGRLPAVRGALGNREIAGQYGTG